MRAGSIFLGIVLLVLPGCARHKRSPNSSDRDTQTPAATVRVSTEEIQLAQSAPIAQATSIAASPETTPVSRPSPFGDQHEADRQQPRSAPPVALSPKLVNTGSTNTNTNTGRKTLKPFVPKPADLSASAADTRSRDLALPAPPQLASIAVTPLPQVPIAAQRPCCVGTAFLEPAKPARLQRMIRRVPGIRRIGQHADTGEGFIAAKPKREVTLMLPREARALLRDGRMDLKASVDESGRVTRVELLSPKEEELVRLASYAASGWSFTPARVNDKTVPSEVVMHFNFQ